MRKTWSNSKTKLKKNRKVILITDREVIDAINILDAERKRLEEWEYNEQMFAFRMRHPYQAPKRVHSGRASRLIRREMALMLAGKKTPDLALQILVNDEVDAARRKCYGF